MQGAWAACISGEIICTVTFFVLWGWLPIWLAGHGMLGCAASVPLLPPPPLPPLQPPPLLLLLLLPLLLLLLLLLPPLLPLPLLLPPLLRCAIRVHVPLPCSAPECDSVPQQLRHLFDW